MKRKHQCKVILHKQFYNFLVNFIVQFSKNEELMKLNEDLLLSQRETLREVDELRVALRLANQGVFFSFFYIIFSLSFEIRF